MPRPAALGLVVIFTLVTALSPAQQVGNANRDYRINGIGSGGSSFVASSAVTGTTVTNEYSTLDPGSPVAWAASSSGNVGWYATPTNSVDIGPAPLLFLANGADPTDPLSPLFRTDGSGNLNFGAPAIPSLAGQSYFFVMAHLAFTSPDGFWISQAHFVSFASDPNLGPGTPTCNPAAIPQALTDDSFVQVPLGFPFPYYGTNHANAFIGSNGYITFGQGDTVYVESVASFLSGSPRISGWWDDLNPAAGGTVTYYTDNAGTAEVCFTNVPEFGFTNQNTFKMTLAAGLFIAFDYGAMASVDALVGLSPGSNLATGLPLNLSVAPHFIPSGSAPYELFTNSNDLVNRQLLFLTDSMGIPISTM